MDKPSRYKPLPVIIDRLQQAILDQGTHRLDRGATMEVARRALGYNSQTELAVANLDGSIDVAFANVHPAGSVILPDGQVVIFAVDPVAGSVFGIDEAYVEQVVDDGQRANRFISTPYGHLLDVSRLSREIIPCTKLSDGEKSRQGGPGYPPPPTLVPYIVVRPRLYARKHEMLAWEQLDTSAGPFEPTDIVAALVRDYGPALWEIVTDEAVASLVWATCDRTHLIAEDVTLAEVMAGGDIEMNNWTYALHAARPRLTGAQQ